LLLSILPSKFAGQFKNLVAAGRRHENFDFLKCGGAAGRPVAPHTMIDGFVHGSVRGTRNDFTYMAYPGYDGKDW